MCRGANKTTVTHYNHCEFFMRSGCTHRQTESNCRRKWRKIGKADALGMLCSLLVCWLVFLLIIWTSGFVSRSLVINKTRPYFRLLHLWSPSVKRSKWGTSGKTQKNNTVWLSKWKTLFTSNPTRSTRAFWSPVRSSHKLERAKRVKNKIENRLDRVLFPGECEEIYDVLNQKYFIANIPTLQCNLNEEHADMMWFSTLTVVTYSPHASSSNSLDFLPSALQ